MNQHAASKEAAHKLIVSLDMCAGKGAVELV